MQINEPTLTGRITEILSYVDLAEMRVSNLRGQLWGEGENSPQQIPPSTMEGQLANICTRLACLCGSLATINSRVGCVPEPSRVPAPDHTPTGYHPQQVL